MVAALVLGTSIERCEGSSPSFGTIAEVAKLAVRAELKPQFFCGFDSHLLYKWRGLVEREPSHKGF